jgi:peptidyl-dipeptidase A
MSHALRGRALLLAALLPGAALATPSHPGQAADRAPRAAEARAFVARVDDELRRLMTRQETADWVKTNFITEDTERIAAWADEELMAYLGRTMREAARFRGVRADARTERALHLLRVAPAIYGILPAPADPALRSELATLSARLAGAYGKAKGCGADGQLRCRDLEELSDTLSHSRRWDDLLEAWAGWHATARPARRDFQRMVALANQGAREMGFADVGQAWRSGYDMPPAALAQEVERLWEQVRPLYQELHCYVRARLQATYGAERVPDGQPIPAHLLGNMWAQQWGDIYPLLEPFPGAGSLDVSAGLVQGGYDALRMVKTGEAFFTSLGLRPLPESFFTRSLLAKPRDREVECHASAWSLDFRDDLRIKMCIQPREEDLRAIHHELGHNYYQWAYAGLPVIFQRGANEGFHEAIGDAVGLSVTPAYLQKLGLLPPGEGDPRSLINAQLREALEKVAFLPFGKLVDQWRWQVFAGEVPPERYNAAWWALRRGVQGVAEPEPRSEADFDPGAKYHVAANVSYTRYFLAHVYMFQFHKALCQAAGFPGPLHQCSVYGSREAGRRLQAMLSLGASRPWPEAMEALTGQRQADAGPLLEYFAPLRAWLAEQNRGRRCGW